MEATLKLKDIYLGVPDGETEARKENVLELFFDSNGMYEELNNNRDKFMIIGNKGSGKSYFGHYYCKRSTEGQVRRVINSQSYLLDELCYNASNDSDSRGIVYALCKWFLLNNLADILIEKHSIKAKIKGTNVYKLKQLKQSYNDESIYKIVKSIVSGAKSKEVVLSKSKEVTEGDIKKNWTGGGNISKQKSDSVERIPKKFFEIINQLENKVFKSIQKSDDISLVFDNLDELDKKLVNNPGDNDIILNLVKVTKEYTERLLDRKQNVRIILLLRMDVLDKLQLYDNNLSKIKKSCGIELYWLTTDRTAPEEHPLIRMILHKIKAKNNVAATMNNKELFSKLFPEKIDNKTPLDYLLSYSFGRPRDIITYLNHVIKQYGNKSAFYAADLKEVRKLYSADFYDELLNQACFHNDPDFINDSFKLISGIKKSTFTFEILEVYFEQNKKYYPHITNLQETVEFLYAMGAIGNAWGKGDQTKTSWAYRKDSIQTVRFDNKFTIHYALRKKFSL